MSGCLLSFLFTCCLLLLYLTVFFLLSPRDRVVHLLALKAYTEPEILLRLKRDGLSDADKAKLHDVLCQVGQPNRQHKFLLLPKLFGDVRLDWPAYDNEDRAIIGR